MGRWPARALFALVVAVLLVAGYVQGAARLPIPVVGSLHEAAFAMLSFSAFVLASGALFLRRARTETVAPRFDGPVTAIVPTYRDAAVLHRSVESLLACDHPVEVVVVCEPDDETGLATAREYAAEHDAVTCLVNQRPGTKAGAINDAVDRTDAETFALFDADQEVPADLFDRVAGYLHENDVVQTRFLPRPTGPVESLAYYEYTLFNYCFRQPLYALTAFRMATSKALLFSRDAFERVGGYDPDVVSEDYDFGHRCYLAGLDVRLVYTHAVTEESAHTVADWWSQRKRWMTGNVQVLHKFLRQLPDRWRNRRTYLSLGIGGASIGGAGFLVSLVPKAAWLAGRGPTGIGLALAPVLATYAVAAAARRRDGHPLGTELLVVPFVLPFFSLITLMAAADYLLDFDGEWFVVEKRE